ncbi:hypothetical protein EOJ36_06125 [Sandaracinomonas limnophila]|uniref:Outer membrane protein beta-barrel domain-containing protein n=1 Tax=Sandaracinomonas limnophila TaxID=1862386 RepID=A0A437PUP7_9BACT|nr:hypothetical protein [Sandaracinomonas limnophila]RVU25989.1 hypothetical protein EOJ36_06125 [Sandaracinomonas limnophila]
MKLIRLVPVSFICFWILSNYANAQNFQFSLGRNQTDYHLVNTNGQPVDYLKPSNGMHLKAGYHKLFLDTLALQLSSPEKALQYSQRPILAKLLSVLSYSISAQMMQLNAIGDVQQIPLRYETDYAGVEVGIGAKLKIKKLVGIRVQGVISGNKLLYGSQLAGNNYYLLKGNEQFDGIKFLKGFQVDISTQINPSTEFVFGYGQYSSLNSSSANTGNFDLTTQTISMGLTFRINK